jgi:hypothetical protein
MQIGWEIEPGKQVKKRGEKQVELLTRFKRARERGLQIGQEGKKGEKGRRTGKRENRAFRRNVERLGEKGERGGLRKNPKLHAKLSRFSFSRRPSGPPAGPGCLVTKVVTGKDRELKKKKFTG